MATREITQLQDRFTGDVNKIRDEKIATASDASGASDMTSQCEFLIKNGQTGEFMNFLKSYIDESVRNALGALVNNLDKGTSIKSVLATDADNDLGSITPANLASVLSALLNLEKRTRVYINKNIGAVTVTDIGRPSQWGAKTVLVIGSGFYGNESPGTCVYKMSIHYYDSNGTIDGAILAQKTKPDNTQLYGVGESNGYFTIFPNIWISTVLVIEV